jgi:hypothetical protein
MFFVLFIFMSFILFVYFILFYFILFRLFILFIIYLFILFIYFIIYFICLFYSIHFVVRLQSRKNPNAQPKAKENTKEEVAKQSNNNNNDNNNNNKKDENKDKRQKNVKLTKEEIPDDLSEPVSKLNIKGKKQSNRKKGKTTNTHKYSRFGKQKEITTINKR